MENIYTSVHYGIRSMGRKYTNKIELIHLGKETLAYSSLNSLWSKWEASVPIIILQIEKSGHEAEK